MEENTTALNAQQDAEAKQESIVNEVQPESQSEGQNPEPVVEDAAGSSDNQENEAVEEVVDFSEKSLSELLALFEQMIKEGDQQKLYKNAESIKAGFYKVLRKEKIASAEIGKSANKLLTSEKNKPKSTE